MDTKDDDIFKIAITGPPVILTILTFAGILGLLFPEHTTMPTYGYVAWVFFVMFLCGFGAMSAFVLTLWIESLILKKWLGQDRAMEIFQNITCVGRMKWLFRLLRIRR